MTQEDTRNQENNIEDLSQEEGKKRVATIRQLIYLKEAAQNRYSLLVAEELLK
jgi:hypothetical protein